MIQAFALSHRDRSDRPIYVIHLRAPFFLARITPKIRYVKQAMGRFYGKPAKLKGLNIYPYLLSNKAVGRQEILISRYQQAARYFLSATILRGKKDVFPSEAFTVVERQLPPSVPKYVLASSEGSTMVIHTQPPRFIFRFREATGAAMGSIGSKLLPWIQQSGQNEILFYES